MTFLFDFTAQPPSNSTKDVELVTEYGKNVTLECPIQLGALSQSYNVSWYHINVSAPKQFDIRVTGDMRSSLTIINIQSENIGLYACRVIVTNPLDGEIWIASGEFQLCNAQKKVTTTALFSNFSCIFYRLYLCRLYYGICPSIVHHCNLST